MARTEYAPRAEYIGTGDLAEYTFDFKIKSLEHLIVGVVTDAFVETFRVRGSDTTYLDSVSYDSEAGGGTVTLASDLPTGHSLYILLADDSPLQESEFRSKGDFTLKRFEDAIDALSGQIQRLTYRVARALQLSDNFPNTDSFDTLLTINSTDDQVEDNTNKVIAVNATNDGFTLGPSTVSLAAQAAAAAASEAAAAASEAAAASSESAAALSEAAAAASEAAAAASEAAAASSAATVALSIFGSTGTPRSIVAATGIGAAAPDMSTTAQEQRIFLKGSTGGENIISANPQIQAGTVIGARMYLVGADNSDYITLNHGTGLKLNGPWSSDNDNCLSLFWDGSNWAEDARKR